MILSYANDSCKNELVSTLVRIDCLAERLGWLRLTFLMNKLYIEVDLFDYMLYLDDVE